ncbi:hypothetical protein A6U98_14135 [Rhizobium sp. WYCCWR10014]|nr:hypothetical protein A6U98_14135 [Rhizobium sp. WYCCWR10014]
MALSFAISIALVLTVFAVELTYVEFGNSGFRRVLFERSKSTITDIVYFVLQATGAKLGLDRDYFNQTDPFRASIATEIRFFQRAGQAARAKRRISPISGKPASPQGLSGPEKRR